MPALRRALYVSFLATAIYGCSSEPTAPTPTPSQSKTDLRAWSTLYTQVDLGLLVGGTNSIARDINDFDVIVGYADVANGDNHAFIKSGAAGAMIDIGVPAGDVNSMAWGINNSGVVVGESNAGGTSKRHAWRWTQASGFEMLGDLGGGESRAFKVNERGWIVGVSATPAGFGFDHAFLWTPAKGMIDLGTHPSGSNSIAQDINEEGHVTGYGEVQGGADTHAFLWTRHDGMIDLGTVKGGALSGGLAINNATHRHHEQIVGFDFGLGTSMWWMPGSGMRKLGGFKGAFNSQAEGINDDQVAVGVSDGGSIGFHAWYAKVGQPLVDLTPGLQATSVAHRINRCGQIVGVVEDAAANSHATLWQRVCK